MKQIVIGLGKVGKPLQEILGADGVDIHPDTFHTPGKYDVVHICFSYNHKFFSNSVSVYQSLFCPDLTIIHSTVPIGTTRQIPNAVHSPVVTRGAVWGSDIKDDLLTFKKWIGGTRASEASDILSKVGMQCIELPEPEHTEALKLLCLAKYGAYIATSFYVKEVCEKVGLGHSMVKEWDFYYNNGMDCSSKVTRPAIYPIDDKIGGSCVISVVEMLNQQFPHEILDGILRYK